MFLSPARGRGKVRGASKIACNPLTQPLPLAGERSKEEE
jgi:hypothetical protein